MYEIISIIQRSPLRYEIILESRITENIHAYNFWKSPHFVRKIWIENKSFAAGRCWKYCEEKKIRNGSSTLYNGNGI